MPLAALVMVIFVFSIMLLVAVVAILWPAALARLNAAGLRTLPVAAPKSMREQAASNSTPGMMRFWGIGAIIILAVAVPRIVSSVLEDGIQEIGSETDSWLAWPIYAIGLAQIVFGSSLLIWSRRIFKRLRVKFDESGADLRRWMVVVVGSVGLGMGAVSLFVAASLA
ncbi:hypothetical protein BJY17_002238 [Agromyces hippuratus]|uniref:Uncharacterized protein n=1 Tax=Agromyces hippuratus TaxID=286438 RepID=A0A852X675_9MICO|nr:hypothetical protein [Agromyces hippuratus]NYG21491.1 hypothetical protein [Agromyces hippuratus]